MLALSGGVGGAKLALGLARVLPPGALTVVANTGDDFEHLGLHIAPDLDTLTYVLAGLDNPETGWGRRDETWSFMAALAELGGETWFRLGDRDLAMHVERTRRLKAGETLSGITADVARRLGIASRILPMTDDKVRTRVETREGVLDFQHYFVGRQCAPQVTGFMFDGAATAAPHPDVLAALRHPELAGRDHLPVQSLHQHRSHPGAARFAGGAGRHRGAGDRRLPDHRRAGRQRADRENDDRARALR